MADDVHLGPATRLLVISPVVHYRHRGQFHAFAGYAREMDVWADLFGRITIAAPCRNEPPAGDCLPLTGEHIALHRVIETGGTILAPLYSRHLVAKFAGQWNGYPGEPWTERLQRRLLGSRWWPGPVLVYGVWPNQPPNVVPLFTSVMTAADLSRARRARVHRRFGGSLRILFVGRLVPTKNVDVLISALARLEEKSVAFSCDIVGDGPERPRLKAQVARLGLNHRVLFSGGLPLTEVLAHYERADVLVRASEAEGWPKVIAEGMAFGLVCIGSNRGLMPWMLDEGRGLTVPPGDAGALAAALERVATDPEIARSSARATGAWRHYSLEDLRAALREVMCQVRERRGCAS